MAVLHSVLVGCICFYKVLYPDKAVLDDLIYGYSPTAQYVYIFSSGYFLWDTIFCLYYRLWPFLIHGVACLFCFSNALYPLFHYYGCAFLSYELSTPFYHMRWFLLKTGKENSIIYKLITAAFMIIFFVIRIIMGLTKSYEWYITVWLYLIGERKCHSQIIF